MFDGKCDWKKIYRLAGISACVLLAYSLVTILVFGVFGEMPTSARQGFDLLAENRLAGMLRLDLLTLLFMPFYYLLMLALFGALGRGNSAAAILAFLLGVCGMTLVLATPSVFSFVTLSDRYAAAADEAQRNLLLAAGEAILASDMWHGSGALLGGLLLQTSLVMFSWLMLHSTAFGKATAFIGLFMHSVDLLHILVGFFSAQAGSTMILIIGPLYLVWFPLLARDFFRMAREKA